ncbi:VOC family protein [Gammaproteobacteria bacterium]|jgi:predicted lactoylglutathione lyase|nr:VOC family protein [Gammaproteobacteria bacterium]MDB3976391.1 VOC family protein [Gammaproteobacteria bacterium]MDB4816518.1 VOC family protein [Gammaproteobacteria bacterium]MDC0509511.1 VOC family protein [Gammaproteobacteria bacterium]MDC0545476.1 VOC family protein [Gammaproteobacteria bacterium]|tara:strand:- start:406 stop:786 length:381 start_codon:yes stop_codon:yes gene_type:complete
MKGKIAKYVTVGTNDLQRAKAFYDELFSELGVTSFGPNERSFFWTIPGDDTNFAVFLPYDGEEATVGNGSMVGITLETTDDVDALYKKAIELGAKDDGEPGQRVPTFYGCYVRDLDGNKLTFCKFG